MRAIATLRLTGILALLILATATHLHAQASSAPQSPPAETSDTHAGHAHEEQTPSTPPSEPNTEGAHDHGHEDPTPSTSPSEPTTEGAHHRGHEEQTPTPPSGATTEDVHHQAHTAEELPPYIPRLTDEDRKAAFPDVPGHSIHDNAVNSFVLFDRLEWQFAEEGSGITLDSKGWIGRDLDRLWFRVEGDAEDGKIGEAEAHVLYGHSFSRWWDVVAGIRQDFRPGPAQTWAAFGVQGLAPYWFELETTAYLGASGRTQVRLEAEYELLLTNRLVLQPLVELDVFGKSDPRRGIGAGLSTAEAGFRLRYEFRREFAPYLGVTWNRKFGKTADYSEAAGEDHQGARLVMGLRLWF